MMETTTVRIVRKKVGQPAVEAHIGSGLDPMQSEVGGLIEAVWLNRDGLTLYCNEEGLLRGLPRNVGLGVPLDAPLRTLWLHGDLFVGGVDAEGDSRSLTDDEVAYAMRLFALAIPT